MVRDWFWKPIYSLYILLSHPYRSYLYALWWKYFSNLCSWAAIWRIAEEPINYRNAATCREISMAILKDVIGQQRLLRLIDIQRNFVQNKTGTSLSLQWCHNERDIISNHRRLECLLSRLFRRRLKKITKLRLTDHPPVVGGFPSQRTSNAQNASISWRHHVVSTGACWWSSAVRCWKAKSNVMTGLRSLEGLCQWNMNNKKFVLKPGMLILHTTSDLQKWARYDDQELLVSIRVLSSNNIQPSDIIVFSVFSRRYGMKKH